MLDLDFDVVDPYGDIDDSEAYTRNEEIEDLVNDELLEFECVVCNEPMSEDDFNCGNCGQAYPEG